MAEAALLPSPQVVIACEMCGDVEDVEWFCMNCDGDMCTKCKEAHLTDKPIFRKHKIVSKFEINKLRCLDHEECSTHQQYHYILFCDQCRKLVCSKCIAHEHNGHAVSEISVAMEQINHKLESICTKLKTKSLIRCDSERRKLGENDKARQVWFSSLLTEVDNRREELKKAVDEVCDNLIKEAAMENSLHELTLSRECQNIDDFSEEINKLIYQIEDSLARGASAKVKLVEEIQNITVNEFVPLKFSNFMPGKTVKEPFIEQVGSLQKPEISGMSSQAWKEDSDFVYVSPTAGMYVKSTGNVDKQGCNYTGTFLYKSSENIESGPTMYNPLQGHLLKMASPLTSVQDTLQPRRNSEPVNTQNALPSKASGQSTKDSESANGFQSMPNVLCMKSIGDERARIHSEPSDVFRGSVTSSSSSSSHERLQEDEASASANIQNAASSLPSIKEPVRGRVNSEPVNTFQLSDTSASKPSPTTAPFSKSSSDSLGATSVSAAESVSRDSQKGPVFDVRVQRRNTCDIRVDNIVPESADGVWICKADSKQMNLLDTSGQTIKKVKTKFNVRDFQILNSEEIVAVDFWNRSIKRVSHAGKILATTTTSGNRPNGICLCNNGQNIAVAMSEQHKGCELVVYKIGKDGFQVALSVQYSHKSTVTQRITQNKNGDFCIVHCGYKTVHILDSRGSPKFTYEGPADKKIKKSFSPWDVCCDNYGHILIADYHNNTVHVLDQRGIFVRYLLSSQDGISRPTSLGIDAAGLLWVGGEKGHICAVKYLQ